MRLAVSRLDQIYNIDKRVVGRGAFGVVYFATHIGTKQLVAVKQMSLDKVKDVPSLQKEIDLLKVMDHPNIVRVYASHIDRSHFCIAMEACVGGELLSVITEEKKKKKLSESQLARVTEQILRATCYIHGRGVVHRDLKPENFLLKTKDPIEKNTIKLIDFGLSYAIKEGQTLENYAGTAQYVAPEVIDGCYGKACDLWSCGVILYILLSGNPPFIGTCDKDLHQKVRGGDYHTKGRLWESVSDDAKDLVRHLLEVDPSLRLTAEQAIQTPWIRQHSDVASSTADAILPQKLAEHLADFIAAGRFKKSAQLAVAFCLHEDEVRDLRAAFIALDKDSNGTLDVNELRQTLLSLPNITEANVETTMAEIDLNGDGSVSYTEFLAATMSQRLYENRDLSWRSFKAFDLNNTGSITMDDMLQVHGRQHREVVAEWFKAIHMRRDKKISYEEFQIYLRDLPF
eukprot:TRINITY_DN18253_c0_g1_i1.p1 TRINITY_DN18253_c0_g1~~TRINITY_DN18253_c0_g1_i1.p1  ORF type:complete len:535 (+),score=115.88 TRINITY_DN18253_c0_g1_i1:237-1607(+)